MGLDHGDRIVLDEGVDRSAVRELYCCSIRQSAKTLPHEVLRNASAMVPTCKAMEEIVVFGSERMDVLRALYFFYSEVICVAV